MDVERSSSYTVGWKKQTGCKSTHGNCTRRVYPQKAPLVTTRRGWNGVEATWVMFAQMVFWSFFLLRKCFCILFVQLKNSSGEKKKASKMYLK